MGVLDWMFLGGAVGDLLAWGVAFLVGFVPLFVLLLILEKDM